MEESTGVTPRALLTRPVLDRRWTFPKEVFDAISGSRRYSPNGPANIPISEFESYARGYRLSAEDWQDTWEDIYTIDNIWLIESAKRAEAKKGTK